MTIYTPIQGKEVAERLQQATQQKQSIYSQPMEQEDYFDWSQLAQIIEIDEKNLTATVQCGVTLGALEEQLKLQGFMFAPYTPDLAQYTIGQFYRDQIMSLTAFKYGQPKFHVMGLEAAMPTGEYIATGGKTVKNVTGYDMRRFFLSSREQLAIITTYTIKLYSRESESRCYLLGLSDQNQQMQFINGLLDANIPVHALVCWNQSAMQSIGIDGKYPLQVFMELRGIQQRVDHDQAKVSQLLERFHIDSQLLSQEYIPSCWTMIDSLRQHTEWHDGFKVPISKSQDVIEYLQEKNIAFWYSCLQGSYHILQQQHLEYYYSELQQLTKQLGGASNIFYHQERENEHSMEILLLQQFKKQFDPQGILNPFNGKIGESNHGTN